MRLIRNLIPVIFLCLMVSCSKEAAQTDTEEDKTEESKAYEPGVSIVKFSDEMIGLVESDLAQGKVVTKSMGLNDALDELGITSMRRLFPDAGEYEPRTRKEGLHKWYVVEYSKDQPLTKAAECLGSVEGIDYVEPKRAVKIEDETSYCFDDPSLAAQWGFISKDNSYDINVERVWEHYTVGKPEVIVGVIDAGIDRSHPDLQANCLGDGYNFVNNSTSITAGSHGTHVAGTIAAVNNNGLGVCGIAGGNYASGKAGVKLLSCQIFMDVMEGGKSTTKSGDTAAAIKWAADHGAIISQNSWGYSYDDDGDGELNSKEREEALAATIDASDREAVDYFIKYAGCDNDGNQLPDSPMKGGVVIFAAGNDGIANGAPANYEPIVAVGAIQQNGARASYSNYGDFVDIAAPGSAIYSTTPDGTYGNKSGTSMACPHVSGVAALVASYYGGPGFTNEMLKTQLIEGSDKEKIPSTYRIGGLLDALGAITYGESATPGTVADLKASANSNNVSLSWTVTKDEKGHPAYGFLLLYGTDRAAVASADQDSEDVNSVRITPDLSAGKTATADLKDLDFEKTYWFKILAYSYNLNYADASSVVAATTGKNNPPVIECTYSGQTTIKSFEAISVPIKIYDPDGHEFTVSYKSGSSADALSNDVSSGDSGKLIVVTAKYADAGTYTGVVTATDQYGASSEFKFTYTIKENQVPVVTRQISNILITEQNGQFNLNLADYFNDPDGESLKYTFDIGDSSILFMNSTGDNVIGTILKYGLTTVTINAYDAKMATASATFKVLGRDGSLSYQAYPNPVSTILNIGTGESLEQASIKIASSTGTVIFDESKQASAFEPAQIDMSLCAPGKYSLTLKFGSKEYTQTIVKK